MQTKIDKEDTVIDSIKCSTGKPEKVLFEETAFPPTVVTNAYENISTIVRTAYAAGRSDSPADEYVGNSPMSKF